MKQSLVVFVLILVAFAASAEVTGAGVDLHATVDTARTAAVPDGSSDTVIDVTGSLMYMLNENTELNPFVGVILEREGAGDLFNPVDRQLGMRLGTGYYITVIEGQRLAFSVGPQAGILLYAQPMSGGDTSYAELEVWGGLWLNMDLSLMNNWLLRFGLDVMDASFSYDKRNDNVWTSFAADSELVRGNVLISLRKLF